MRGCFTKECANDKLHCKNVFVTIICVRVSFVETHSRSLKLYNVCRTAGQRRLMKKVQNYYFFFFIPLDKCRHWPSQQDVRGSWRAVHRCLYLCVCVLPGAARGLTVLLNGKLPLPLRWGAKGGKVVNEICQPGARSFILWLTSAGKRSFVPVFFFFSSASEICTLHFSASALPMPPHTQRPEIYPISKLTALTRHYCFYAAAHWL